MMLSSGSISFSAFTNICWGGIQVLSASFAGKPGVRITNVCCLLFSIKRYDFIAVGQAVFIMRDKEYHFPFLG